MEIPERVFTRFLAKYHVNENGCWISEYSSGSHGYAQIGWGEGAKRFLVLGHRLSWQYYFGPIPDQMTVDHMCKTKKCFNPEHLRLLSNAENGRRNNGADYPVGQSCKRNHSPDRRYYRVNKNDSHWICRDCENIAKQKYADKIKDLLPNPVA